MSISRLEDQAGSSMHDQQLKPAASATDIVCMYPTPSDDPQRESVQCARCGRVTDESTADDELWGYWGNGVGDWVLLCPACSRPALLTAPQAATP